MPDVRSLRIPVKYLANMLTAGDEAPVVTALERMLAMRAYMRAKTIDGVIDEGLAQRVGLTGAMIEDMYKIMALADYEDRFVIPTTHREQVEEAYDIKSGCGFHRWQWMLDRDQQGKPFRRQETTTENADGGHVMDRTLKALSLLLSYPTTELQAAMPEIGGVLAA